MKANPITKTAPSHPGVQQMNAHERVITPAVDIYETGETLTLVADLPGVQEQDLEITIDKDILMISARGVEKPEGRRVAREFDYDRYQRKFRLTEAVDSGKVSAELNRGVLTLTLAKTAAAVPRRVDVTTVH